MGRSFTPSHAVEMTVAGFYYTPAGWPTKDAGRPTDANLAGYVRVFEASTQPGGVNAHLGPQRVLAAKIVTNRGERKTVATYEAAK